MIKAMVESIEQQNEIYLCFLFLTCLLINTLGILYSVKRLRDFASICFAEWYLYYLFTSDGVSIRPNADDAGINYGCDVTCRIRHL